MILLLVQSVAMSRKVLFPKKVFHECCDKRDWEIPPEVKTVILPVDSMLQEILFLALIILKVPLRFSHKLRKPSSITENNLYASKHPPLLHIVPVSFSASSGYVWQLEWGFMEGNGDVKHTWDSTGSQFWAWRIKEVPSEAAELLVQLSRKTLRCWTVSRKGKWSWWCVCSTSLRGSNWGRWDYSAWRKGGTGGTSSLPTTPWKEVVAMG